MSTNVVVPAKPTKLLVEKNDKDELTKGRIEDGTLLYVRLREGELAYGSETERNLAVQVAVTKDTAHNWKSVFPKNGYKEVTNEEFVKSYKIDPPYPEQDDQYIVRLKSHATYQNDNPERDIKAGDLVPYDNPSRPKLYEIVDGKAVDITMTKQPVNGSKGVVAFRATSNKFGVFPILSGIVVTDLIEAKERGGFESDYGITAESPATQHKQISAPAQSNDKPEPAPSAPDTGFGDEGWF